MLRFFQRFSRRQAAGCRVNRPANAFQPALELLEERRLMSVISFDTRNNGKIIPHVQVETVFYGSVWTNGTPTNYQNTNSYELNTEAVDLNNFFSTITNSQYLDDLSQYTASNGAPGHGQFLGTDFVPGLSPNQQISPLTTIQDSDITKMLQSEMDHGHLPPADGNKLYVVFLPPGEATTGDSGSGGGHHDSFTTTSGVKAYFATVEHPLSGFKPRGLVGTETVLQQYTEVISHELVEAITDPVVNTAWHGSRYGNEIGDITQIHPPSGGAMGLDYGYAVQKYWSEKDQTSVDPAGTDFLPVTQMPNDLPGQHFTFHAQQNGVTNTYTLQINYQVVNANGNPNTSTFTGQWGAQNVHGSLWLDGQSAFVHIRIYGDSDGTMLFDGQYAPPDGNWQAGGTESTWNDLEMWGTVYQNGSTIHAFGTEDTYYRYGGDGGGSGADGLPPNPHNHPLPM
jgi:hypothetical protein